MPHKITESLPKNLQVSAPVEQKVPVNHDALLAGETCHALSQVITAVLATQNQNAATSATNQISSANSADSSVDWVSQFNYWINSIKESPGMAGRGSDFVQFLISLGAAWPSLSNDAKTTLENLIQSSTFNTKTPISVFNNVYGIQVNNLGEFIAYADVFSYFYTNNIDISKCTNYADVKNIVMPLLQKHATDLLSAVNNIPFLGDCTFLTDYKNVLQSMTGTPPSFFLDGWISGHTYPNKARTGYDKLDDDQHVVDSSFQYYPSITSYNKSIIDNLAPFAPPTPPTPSSSLDPFSPTEIDPGFDPDIFYKNGNFVGFIGYEALMEKFRQIFHFLSKNTMNIAETNDIYNFLLNLGKGWDTIKGSLTKDQLTTIQTLLNQPIGKETITIFGSFTVSSLGEIVGYAMCLAPFFSSNGDKSAIKTEIQTILNDMNSMCSDFSSDFMSNVKKAAQHLLEIDSKTGKAIYDEWADKHWDSTNKQSIDDNSWPCDFSRFINDAQGYMGTLLNYRATPKDKTTMQEWMKTYYDSLISEYATMTQGIKDPAVLLIILLSVINKRISDSEDDIVALSVPSTYLGYVNEKFADAMSIFAKHGPNTTDWTPEDAKQFMQDLEDAKRMITNDTDIPDSLKKTLLGDIKDIVSLPGLSDTTGGTPPTIEQSFKDGKINSLIYGLTQATGNTNTNNLVTKKLQECIDGCKEQSNTQGQLATNATNSHNQILATFKDALDELIKGMEASIKNQRTN